MFFLTLALESEVSRAGSQEGDRHELGVKKENQIQEDGLEPIRTSWDISVLTSNFADENDLQQELVSPMTLLSLNLAWELGTGRKRSEES